MAEDMGEKTEDPTGKRLADARNRGNVPKSQDLSGAIALATAVILILALGGRTFEGLAHTLRRVLMGQTPGGDAIHMESALPAFIDSMASGLLLLLPFLILTFVVAAATQLAQVGFLFTTQPIKPNVNKLNPVSGTKKLFGMKNAVKSGVNSIKMAAVIAAAFFLLSLRLPQLGALPGMHLIPAVLTIGRLMLELAILLCIMLLVIGIIDYIYQRWQHKKDLRMTKHEVKDERRSMEGDMGIKRRRFEMYRKLVSNQIQSATPEADVVIANPTHFAVVIKYDQDKMHAPTVTAKGADLLAFHIRSIAKAHNVPIVERPPLARAIFANVEVGQEIAPEHYEAVAEILAYVYRIDERARGKANPQPQPAGAA